MEWNNCAKKTASLKCEKCQPEKYLCKKCDEELHSPQEYIKEADKDSEFFGIDDKDPIAYKTDHERIYICEECEVNLSDVYWKACEQFLCK